MTSFFMLSSWVFSQLALVLLICIMTSAAQFDPPWKYNMAEIGSRLHKYYMEVQHGSTSEDRQVCKLSALEKKKLCKRTLLKYLKDIGIEAVFEEDTSDSLHQLYECSKKKIKYPVQTATKKKATKERAIKIKATKKKTKVKVQSLKLSAFYCPKFQMYFVKEKRIFTCVSFFISNGDTQNSIFVHQPTDKSKGVNNKTVFVWFYKPNAVGV